ncbi:MAG: MarR family transcriptional regulator [Actinobacteria bacterium]|nr:MarR family transcriptional regulator [Actinomycetota bacterium]
MAAIDDIVRRLPAWISAVDAVNEHAARQAGIGVSDLACVHELVVDGPLPSGELARRLRLSTGAVTHMIDRLIAAGLVTRTRDDNDRRRVFIQVDPAARAGLLDAYAGLDHQIRRTLSRFTAAELAVIDRFVADCLTDTQALLDQDEHQDAR